MRHFWRRFRPPTKTQTAAQPVDTNVLLEALLARTPGAVEAQRSMDKHPGAYHTNKTRLYELIDFNDAFVELAIALSPAERTGFIDRLKQRMSQYCRDIGSPMFTDEQYEAITRGLSREVAVYLGAKEQGFEVVMASRTQDAMGVDMTITDPRTGRSLNIDCKSPSAYHFRLKDLRHQGRLTEDEAERAEISGYVSEVNGHGAHAVAVTILRIDPNETGEIRDLTFTDPTLLAVRLRDVLNQTTKKR